MPKNVTFLPLLRRILTIAHANSATSWLQTMLRNCSYARKANEMFPIFLQITLLFFILLSLCTKKSYSNIFLIKPSAQSILCDFVASFESCYVNIYCFWWNSIFYYFNPLFFREVHVLSSNSKNNNVEYS